MVLKFFMKFQIALKDKIAYAHGMQIISYFFDVHFNSFTSKNCTLGTNFYFKQLGIGDRIMVLNRRYTVC